MGGLPIDGDPLKTAEVFPSQDCLQDVCSVPDLPFGRSHHTLSVLSSGTFVVCGGQGEEEQNSEESGGYGYGEGEGSGSVGYSDDEGSVNNDYGESNSNSTRTSSRSDNKILNTCLTLEFAGTENAYWEKNVTFMR